MIDPTVYERPVVEPSSGNIFSRGLVTLFIERRLPYRIRLLVDRTCNRLGWKRKKIRAGGFTLVVRRQTCDENFVHNIILKDEYTCEGYEIGAADTVIDIGGNIGTFTLVASRRAHQGIVYSFEPNQENYDLMNCNLRLNGVKNVVANRNAISDQTKTIKLFTASEGGFHSVMEDRMADSENYEVVDALDLASVFDQHNIERCHFLKLDCEGAEHEILHGLPPEYFERIDKIAMEFHGPPDRLERRQQSDALVQRLEDNGLQVTSYEEFDPEKFQGGFIFAKRGSTTE